MKFSDIPGYTNLKEKLVQAADAGQVAHAQLFAAAEGGFGLMLALAYAQYLNCENPSQGDSCGTCFSCIKSGRFVHPDFHYLFPLAKSKKLDSD
jgi:DNA polymerase-3 subunit delta'